MEEEDRYTRITLRIPRDLHGRLTREAFITSKSQNAEIIGRLESSFDAPLTAALPAAVDQAIEAEQRERGGTRDEALTRLVLAGQAQGGTLVNLRVGPGTSIPKLHAILDVAMKALKPDAKTVVTLDATQPD